jgi:glycosyltransferase involved in cell wall biosynthesis
MNICLFSSNFLPNIGGIANHVAELGRALVKLDHNIIVVTHCDFKEHKKFNLKVEYDNGMKIFRIPIINIPKLRGLNRRISDLYYLRKIIKENNIDILHWHCLFSDSYVTKKLNFNNLIFTNHTSTFLQLLDQGKYKKLRKNIFHANEIITPSEELKEKTIELGFPSNKVHYISNGVDINRFTPNINVEELKKELSISKKEKVVLCARRFAKKNGVIYLVKAIPKILKAFNNKVKFIFVGDFPLDHPDSDKKRILKYISNNDNIKKNVIITGAIPSEKMPQYYSLGDISVLPSLKEATSLSGLESMACGVPVVGTNVGGIPQIIEDQINGILVPPENSQKLAEEIISILKNDKKRKVFSKRAVDFVKENYSWVRVAKDTIKVYSKLL